MLSKIPIEAIHQAEVHPCWLAASIIYIEDLPIVAATVVAKEPEVVDVSVKSNTTLMY
jgi:hypothetical protein